MLTLRPYQQEAIAAVYRYLREHDDNPVVVIPTAGGKTPLLATICKDTVTRWNGRVLILAHVKELLEQAADKLRAVCPEVKFGVYSAGLKRRDTEHAVIVAGIQSVYRRAGELDAFNLIICDECHLLPLDGDGMYRQFLAEAKAVNPQVRVIGLTATPFRLDSGRGAAGGAGGVRDGSGRGDRRGIPGGADESAAQREGTTGLAGLREGDG